MGNEVPAKAAERFVDLLDPFKNFSYYNPGQEGSASLKKVLPALTGSSYKGLEINNGQAAAAEYYRVTFNDVDPKDRQAVRDNLLKYCGLDTSGMIGAGNQAAQLLPAGFSARVDGNAFLAGVEQIEKSRVPRPRTIRPRRAFHLDHLGAKLLQQMAA